MTFSVASHFHLKQSADWSKQNNFEDMFYFFLNVINQGRGTSGDGTIVNMDGHEYYIFVFNEMIDCMV